MSRTSGVASRQRKAMEAFRSRASKSATTPGVATAPEITPPQPQLQRKPQQVNMYELHQNLKWVLEEIDRGSIRATPAQRAALAAAEKFASQIYDRYS